MSASPTRPSLPPPAPSTYLCTTCNLTLSDSYTLYSFCRPLSAILLTACPNTHLSTTPTTSPAGSPDEFCVFRAIQCNSCDSTLGRFYLAVTKDLEPLRERYALQLEKIRIYELGGGVREGGEVMETLEILDPKPEVVVWRVNQVMSSVVLLQEELEGLGARVDAMSTVSDRLRSLEETMAGLQMMAEKNAASAPLQEDKRIPAPAKPAEDSDLRARIETRRRSPQPTKPPADQTVEKRGRKRRVVIRDSEESADSESTADSDDVPLAAPESRRPGGRNVELAEEDGRRRNSVRKTGNLEKLGAGLAREKGEAEQAESRKYAEPKAIATGRRKPKRK